MWPSLQNDKSEKPMSNIEDRSRAQSAEANIYNANNIGNIILYHTIILLLIYHNIIYLHDMLINW